LSTPLTAPGVQVMLKQSLLASIDVGRMKEKLHNFEEATILAKEARAQYEETRDLSGLALCCHTMAVWAFHQGDDVASVRDFQLAADFRDRIGELLP
jgi:hypothetical protein